MPLRLKTVEMDGTTLSGHAQYKQVVDEAIMFHGRQFAVGDEWIGAVLYPDYLGISFAERLADMPQFVGQVEARSGQRISAIRGIASAALPGDPLLLGDWIKNGSFDPERLARRFAAELGGRWRIVWKVKDPKSLIAVYELEIARESE